MGKKLSIEQLKAALAEQSAKGAEADVKAVLATAEQLTAALEENASKAEQRASAAEQDVSALNEQLAAYEQGKVKPKKPTVTANKQKYRVMYPTVGVNGKTYTIDDLKKNVSVIVDGKEIGLVDYLLKIKSGALKPVK